MRPRFQADENFNARIIAGLFRREPAIGIQTAKAAGGLGLGDPEVLASAAGEGRILVSHDRETMRGHFRDFVSGRSSAGLLIVSQTIEIREAIEQLLLVWSASEEGEWRDRIGFVPF